MRWQILLAGAAAAWFLFRSLPAALLFVSPGLLRSRETDDDGSLDPAREPAMERVARALAELGFEKIGAIEVRPPLSAPSADLVWASTGKRAFADVAARGGRISVTFFSPFPGGRAVLTSDFRRPSVAHEGYLAGGLAGIDVAELWAVHQRRVEHFRPPAAPWTDFTAAGRVRAEEAVLLGPGRRDLRRRSAGAAIVALLALAVLAVSVLQLVRLA